MAATDPAASAARCTNAPRRLRSAPWTWATAHAPPRLVTSPSDATTTTPAPLIVSAEPIRWNASNTTHALVTSSMTACGLGAEHLGPLQPVGVTRRGRPRHEQLRREGDAQPHDVGPEVGGISQQRGSGTPSPRPARPPAAPRWRRARSATPGPAGGHGGLRWAPTRERAGQAPRRARFSCMTRTGPRGRAGDARERTR